MKVFFKKFQNKTVIAILLVIASSLCSCDVTDNGIYPPNSRFWATVEGTVDGERVKATVFCDPTEHLTKEIYSKLSVTFAEPQSLEGITVTLRSDQKATLRLKGIEEDLPLYYNLSEPFSALMPSKEPSTIQKTDRGTLVTYGISDNESISYLFDKSGTPISITGTYRSHNISLTVTKFSINAE